MKRWLQAAPFVFREAIWCCGCVGGGMCEWLVGYERFNMALGDSLPKGTCTDDDAMDRQAWRRLV